MTVSNPAERKTRILKTVLVSLCIPLLLIFLAVAISDQQSRVSRAEQEAQIQKNLAEQAQRAADEQRRIAEEQNKAYQQAIQAQQSPSVTRCTSNGYSMLNTVDTTCTSF